MTKKPPSGRRLTRLALEQPALDEEPRGSSEGGKRNRHVVDLLFAGNESDRSTRLRTAPTHEGGTHAEVRSDVRHGDELLRPRSDEQPLVEARPVEHEPTPVRGPDDVGERAGAAEDRCGRATQDARDLERAA